MTQPQPPVTDVAVGGGTAAAILAAEVAMTAAVLAAYATWLTAVSALLFAVLPINPDAVWSLVPSWNRQVTKLMRDLNEIARMGWEAAASDLGIDAPYDPTNPVLQDQLRRTRNFMVNTPNEVYAMILRVLNDHAGDPAAQQRAVNDVLNLTGTANWRARAKTVAVTEVHRAFNFGSIAMAMNVPGRVIKRWNAKDDAATRPFHAAADGQKRPVFQAFDVGGESLLAPGDPSGSAWNVINCRCKLSYSRSQNAR